MSRRNPSQALAANEFIKHQKADRRRAMRHTITLPVQVQGEDSDKAQWQEVAQTLNVSPEGLALRLSKKVMIGDILYLEVPLPARMRKDAQSSPSYNSYAIVRHIEMREGSQQIVRLRFIEAKVPA